MATDFGEPICTTKSIEPMSMPSSREVEETTALSAPLRRSSSTSRRVSRLKLPWWAPICSTPRSLSLYTTLSVPLRVFVNTNVVVWSSTISFSRSYIFELTTSKDSVVISSVGQITLMSSERWPNTSTMFICRATPPSKPARNSATSSTGATVAERPMRISCLATARSSRSRAMDSATPRFESHISWTSSTMTY